MICTKENPYRPGMGPSQHPDAKHIYDEYDSSASHDDYKVYECPNCGLIFEVTIPN